MATVRAATQAMARKQERLAGQTQANSDTQPKDTPINPPTILSSPMHPFNPIATSSPEGLPQAGGFSVSVGTSGPNSSHLAPNPHSPTVSEAGSTLSLPDEVSWLRHQHYVAPEKLQIVKPLEGSVTLLKWKLLASPQLGGATSFFSDASRPGVHVKGWKAAGIVDRERGERRSEEGGDGGSLGLPQELRFKSLSTSDLSHIASSSSFSTPQQPSHHHTPTSSQRHRRGVRRGKDIHSRLSNLTSSTSIADSNGMDALPDVSRSHDQGARSHDKSSPGERRGSVKDEARGEEEKRDGHSSLLQTVGNLFGWSRLGLGGSRGAGKSDESHNQIEIDEEEVDSHSRDDMGLAGIL